MQMKLRGDYRVQVSKRVHVSRIVLTPLAAARTVLGLTSGGSAPNPGTHSRILLHVRNSRCMVYQRPLFFLWHGLSLQPPRHPCYALLSSALSRLVRETSRNSYQPRQDGLW